MNSNKRKRSGVAGKNTPEKRLLEAKKYLEHHAPRVLGKAIKTTRGLEVAKYTRRAKKDGKAEDSEMRDLLKILPTEALPWTTMRNRLKRDEALKPFYAELKPIIDRHTVDKIAPGTAEGKATALLLGAKQVLNAWNEVLSGLKKRLNVEVPPRGEAKKGGPQSTAKSGPTPAETAGAAPEREDAWNGSSDPSLSASEGPSKLPSDGEEPAISDDEDAAIERELRRLNGASDADSDSEAESESDSENETPARRPAKKQKSENVVLPSLAAGFIDYSSDEEDAQWLKKEEAKDSKAERKNRRGQRARQAIWEKKYGKHANHVVKKEAPQNGTKKSAGSYNNRNADSKERYSNKSDSNNSRYVPNQTGSNTTPLVADKWNYKNGTKPASHAKTESKEKLHPSWEAKRKAKEAQQQLMTMKGKKITFD